MSPTHIATAGREQDYSGWKMEIFSYFKLRLPNKEVLLTLTVGSVSSH